MTRVDHIFSVSALSSILLHVATTSYGSVFNNKLNPLGTLYLDTDTWYRRYIPSILSENTNCFNIPSEQSRSTIVEIRQFSIPGLLKLIVLPFLQHSAIIISYYNATTFDQCT